MTKSTITREPITHDIKIYPEFFSAVCTGVKRAELRKNDRDYRVGDTIHLMETPRGSCHRTGEFINVTITHIADIGEWMPGYVLLSVELQERRKADSEPVAEVVSIYGDPEAFGEREIRPLVGIQQMPYGTKLYRHAQPAPVVPDEMLCEFYEVDSWPDLVRELVKHVEQLQGSARRNVKPWEDTFPETLLPAYIERVKQADDACRAAMLAAAPQLPGSEPATAPGKWIPVSERMPESNKFVLVSNGVWVGQGLYDDSEHLESDEHWQDEHREFINVLHHPVTHWMPLPAAPQEPKP